MLKRIGYGFLASWPLLIAAAVAVTAGTRLLTSVVGREMAAAALLTIGSVCLGAWVAMLSAHDYPGREIPPADGSGGEGEHDRE